MTKTNYDEKLKECIKYIYSVSGENEANAEKYSDNAVKYMNRKTQLENDITVRILKGGSYKIKDYYLENNILKDIRGASVLLTYVEEKIIPDMISKEFSRSCIIYCGGGNIFALVPDNIDSKFNIKLEEEAQKYLVTANIAYCISEPIKLSDLLGKNYKIIISKNENELNERKKIKIIDSRESLSFIDSIEIEDIKIKIDKQYLRSKKICKNCGKRIAYYKNTSCDNKPICAGCFHKNRVGNNVKNKKYLDEYLHYTQKNAEAVTTLEDIDINHIAVVYGDGNNMGGIIQSLEKITDMMKFSDTVKTASNESVFKAMSSSGITKFEIVGLGGDDVFVIIPADKAIMFSKYLIENYYKIFHDAYPDIPSTMSVGIAIAKTQTPIKIILKSAEEKLEEAKKLSKKSKNDEGSLSFTILNSNNDSSERINTTTKAINTLLPYSIQTVNDILKFVNKIEKENLVSNSRIRNLSEAFENAESYEEASLFFEYMNAKSNNTEFIRLPDINGYNKSKDLPGYYIDSNNNKRYIWDDLINLLEYKVKE